MLGAEVLVHRNDAITVEAARALAPTHLCISPGPGHAARRRRVDGHDRVLRRAACRCSVCASVTSRIVEVFGGEVVRAGRLMHGKVSLVEHDGRRRLRRAAATLAAGRYHSLIARPESLPAILEVTARTPEGEIMGVRHRELAVEGVQFHPESILTPDGPALLGNFLALRDGRACRESR